MIKHQETVEVHNRFILPLVIMNMSANTITKRFRSNKRTAKKNHR